MLGREDQTGEQPFPFSSLQIRQGSPLESRFKFPKEADRQMGILVWWQRPLLSHSGGGISLRISVLSLLPAVCFPFLSANSLYSAIWSQISVRQGFVQDVR